MQHDKLTVSFTSNTTQHDTQISSDRKPSRLQHNMTRRSPLLRIMLQHNEQNLSRPWKAAWEPLQRPSMPHSHLAQGAKHPHQSCTRTNRGPATCRCRQQVQRLASCNEHTWSHSPSDGQIGLRNPCSTATSATEQRCCVDSCPGQTEVWRSTSAKDK